MTINYMLLLMIALRILANPLANVFQKKLTDNFHWHPLWVNASSFILIAIFLSIIFLPQLSIENFSTSFYLWALAAGLMGALGNACLITAIRGGELSVIGPINSYKALIGLIAAFFFTGELPSFIGFIGILIMIAGSYLLFYSPKQKQNIQKRHDIRWRILAMICTAIEAVFLKIIIQEQGPIPALLSWSILGAIFGTLMAFIWGSKSKLSPKTIPIIFIVAFFMATMQFSTNYVFQYMEVSLSLSLFQLSGPISVLLGWKIFKEANLTQKLIGSAIMAIGSVLILMQ